MKKTVYVLVFLLMAGRLYAVDPTNAFCILPLFEEMFMQNRLSDAEVQTQIDRMKTQLGSSRLYFKTGFAGIFRDNNNLERNFQMAYTNQIALGVIIRNSQTHALNTTIKSLLKADVRRYQWRLDGVNWYGVTDTNSDGSVEYPARDFNRITESRYATEVRAAYESNTRTLADFVVQMNRKYPGVLAAVNTAIEEEQASAGGASDNYLADYSPFAVTEFRDWLRHVGKYDDSTGEFARQGAPPDIVGPYLLINGVWRSPFYDDPTPADSNGTGVSFNQFFGTSFSTWTLRYYDLTVFPAPIPYTNGMENTFNISPQSGTGFTDGGFDPPRMRNITNNYWQAWSWDVLDQNAYPPGNPLHPAFGFRQTMVHNWCCDTLDWVREEGVPANMLYTHQIPAEVVTASRLRSSASPIWTGSYAPSGTEGITRFGLIDPNLLLRYERQWGIFEWHPRPWNANRGASYNTDLYNDTIQSLNSYYWSGARVLFPGWWTTNTIHTGETFPLADSTFASGIKDWLTAQSDRLPPAMGSGSGLSATTNGATVQLTGWVQPFYTENYAFWTVSGSGAVVMLNGTRVINGQSVALQAGQLYSVTITYSLGTAPNFSWSSDTMPKLTVPISQLYPTGDTDGDGMSDHDEAMAGRDAHDAGDLAFLFNADGDDEGWNLPDQLSSISISGGIYNAVSTGIDPKIQRNSGFSFDTREVPGFLVRMKCDKPGRVDLFFGNTIENYVGTRRLTTNLLETNVWKNVYLPGAGVAEWGNFIVTKMRFDPINQADAAIEIDWIRASNGDLDGDGIADVDEPAGDTDHDGLLDVLDTDSDGDGQSDAAERIGGSDPYDSSSRFGIDPAQFDPGTGEIAMNGLTNRIYLLFRKTNLADGLWVAVDSVGSLVSNQSVVLHDAAAPGESNAFYRIHVSEVQ